MKIYVAKVMLSHAGETLSYHSSKREAEKATAKAKRDFKSPAQNTGDVFQFASVKSCDCELTRPGVIRFLNNFTPGTDNG